MFRAFGEYKRGDRIAPEVLRRMRPSNLRALQDQRFIVAWPRDEGASAAPARPGEVYIAQRPGPGRYDVYFGEKLNGAPLSKMEADALAAQYQPQPAKSTAA